jgi:hypothetical protein
VGPWQRRLEQLQPLTLEFRPHARPSSNVATWLREARDESRFDWVTDACRDDGYGARHAPSLLRHGGPDRDDDVAVETDHLPQDVAESLEPPLG